ncbi:glycosyltransferase [Maribacter arcticus]|uniref:N-acetylgalactosamine-N,N'-diacetylbacillosaminyl-diphospho-undecaprenol 4-alpha-N-acetylgalactosaminyltransferase n=1 Tax=Maribacter arcticus TaxID=561365 RepID=A0A1T5BI63_9FLAO|nr:glycosyltransferase [Maribacter arcticus]SKB46503.1 N-acetylgalactosamine-N,N'-diacetylbacillosaminyl-diphospho-undecaprenol 4-alpha-N-acetylgalactosaminyltransferase [Maribacter arcticus]
MKNEYTKIAILIFSLAGGGAERVVSYLLPFLKNKGFDVHLILMNETISYDIPKDIPIHFIENSWGNESGLLKLVKLPILAYKYAKLLKSLEITHSFAMLTRSSYINILSRYFTSHKFKLIISERSHPSMQYGYGNLQSKINNWLIKRLYPKADKIICNSIGNGEDLINNYNIPKQKITVINNPINIEAIEAVEKEQEIFKSNTFNLVTIGRMDKGKNHELLIRAVEGFSNIHLYILGDGVLRDFLEGLVIDKNLKDRVTFLGFDNNPFKYLKAADLFVFGSNHEGFPNVLLEAMCCGLPILSTNCKSGPDEIMQLTTPITDDIMLTDYGILSPVENVELFKKGLSYCLEHPDYLAQCRINVKKRIQDFKREPILELYTAHILS